MNAGDRSVRIHQLLDGERPPRPAVGRRSVWINGCWHSAHRNSSATACGQSVSLEDHRYLGPRRERVCDTCEANDRRTEPELGL